MNHTSHWSRRINIVLLWILAFFIRIGPNGLIMRIRLGFEYSGQPTQNIDNYKNFCIKLMEEITETSRYSEKITE